MIEEARRAGALPENYEPDRFTVVGVAEDVLYGGLSNSALPLVYVPYAQGSEGQTNMFLTVRSDGNPLALTGAIREQIAQLDRDQPIANIQTMEARVSASVAQRRMQMNVLGLFSAMAVAAGGDRHLWRDVVRRDAARAARSASAWRSARPAAMSSRWCCARDSRWSRWAWRLDSSVPCC